MKYTVKVGDIIRHQADGLIMINDYRDGLWTVMDVDYDENGQLISGINHLLTDAEMRACVKAETGMAYDRVVCQRKYEVDYRGEDGKISPIDTITADSDYTAEDYISDCEGNADPDYVEMLKNGDVTLTAID